MESPGTSTPRLRKAWLEDGSVPSAGSGTGYIQQWQILRLHPGDSECMGLLCLMGKCLASCSQVSKLVP